MRANKRNVGIGVAAHHVGGRGAAVGEKNLNRPRALNDVIIGQNVPSGVITMPDPAPPCMRGLPSGSPGFALR